MLINVKRVTVTSYKFWHQFVLTLANFALIQIDRTLDSVCMSCVYVARALSLLLLSRYQKLSFNRIYKQCCWRDFCDHSVLCHFYLTTCLLPTKLILPCKCMKQFRTNVKRRPTLVLICWLFSLLKAKFHYAIQLSNQLASWFASLLATC